VLAVSLELATAKWKVALHDGRWDRPAVHSLAEPHAAARLQAVLDLIERHKVKWVLPADVRVVVSYEAGQDAFWIYRALQAQHIECYIVDPASIPVERHKRRAKTDRLDAIKLVINLRAWLHGERDRMRVIRVPSPQDGELGLDAVVYRPIWTSDGYADIDLAWNEDQRNPAVERFRLFAINHFTRGRPSKPQRSMRRVGENADISAE
jgi:hypothetical protein